MSPVNRQVNFDPSLPILDLKEGPDGIWFSPTTTPAKEWSGSQCPITPDNCWVDDDTGEHVNATTNVRTLLHAPQVDINAELNPVAPVIAGDPEPPPHRVLGDPIKGGEDAGSGPIGEVGMAGHESANPVSGV